MLLKALATSWRFCTINYSPPHRSPGLPLTSSTIGHKGIKDQSLFPPPTPRLPSTHYAITLLLYLKIAVVIKNSKPPALPIALHSIVGWSSSLGYTIVVGVRVRNHRILRINQCLSIVKIFIKSSIIVIKSI